MAKDPAKSEALWKQLLSLPAALDARRTRPPRTCTVHGLEGAEFSLPDFPPIVLVRLENRALLAGTNQAVAAAVQTFRSQENILQDPAFKPLLERLSPDTSKAVLIHASRSLAAASRLAGRREAKDLAMAAQLSGDLTLSLVTHERPTQLIVQLDAAGLPNVPNIIKALAQQRPPAQSQMAVRRGR
jgi:hypothetical protein